MNPNNADEVLLAWLEVLSANIVWC